MRQTSGDQANAVSKDQVKFNKKLLDFDYGSDDDDDKNSPSVPLPANAGMPDLSQVPAGNIAQILSDPNVLKQLQNLQKLKQQEEKQTKLSEMMLKEEKFEKHLASVLMKLPFANECDLSRQPPIDVNAGKHRQLQKQQSAEPPSNTMSLIMVVLFFLFCVFLSLPLSRFAAGSALHTIDLYHRSRSLEGC